MRQLIAFCAALLLATAVHATVIDAGSGNVQVCRFEAGKGDDPIHRWFSAGSLTCTTPAAMTFPAGRWNVFARSDKGVSVEPVLVDSRDTPESLHLEQVAGATLTVQLPAGSSGVVYFPRHASAVLVDGRTMVPAGEELWLFVTTKGSPVAVFPIVPIAAGSERAVDARVAPETRSLVAWIEVPDQDREVLRKREIGAPNINARTEVRGARGIDGLGVPKSDRMHGALVLFPNVDASPMQLELRGRSWLPDGAVATVGSGPLTIVPRPLVARLSAILTVNWSTYDDLDALDRSIGSCEASGAARLELVISSCTSKPGVREAECRPIRTEALSTAVTFGAVSVGEVAPGTYEAQLRYGKLPPVVSTMALAPLDSRPLYVGAPYIQISGNLTRGGAPLDDDTRIDFPLHGIGFARRGEKYKGALTSMFQLDAKLDVVNCHGDHRIVLADEPPRRVAKTVSYDIDIPDNVLNVKVMDTFTHTPVPSPRLRYVVMSKSMPFRPVLTENLTARDDAPDGTAFVLRSVPTERRIMLEVSSHGYKSQSLDWFTMTKTETKNLEVQLVPLSGGEGKITSSKKFVRATLRWFNADGTENDHADVDPDGTFISDGVHYRGETLILVSASHPLWVMPAPLVERRKTLQLAFPDAAPVRNIRATLPGYPLRVATAVGLAVGGLRVPGSALAEHFALRELGQPLIVGPGPLLIPAIAETAPIDVLRGPAMPGQLREVPRGNFAPVATRRVQKGVDDVDLSGK